MANEKPYFVSPGWRILMQDIGLDPSAVLKHADLPADLFAREKGALTTEEYFRLWRGMEQVSGDPNLPLRLGSAISTEAFDPPIFAALCSPDLNSALQRLAQYKRLMGMMVLHVDVGDDATTLDLEWLDNREEPPACLVLAELVFFVQLARLATRTKVKPLRISSPHLPEDKKAYAKYLGVSVRRGDAPRLHFSPADAAQPFLTANEGMWEFFEKELKKRLSDLTESATIEERVQAALLELLPSGGASMETVAKKLGTSPRTLQRRLKDEGYSFQSLLDQTRESLAKHYLRTSAMTGTEISFLLGYEDPNSFFRAFNSWTGTTPERARRELAVAR